MKIVWLIGDFDLAEEAMHEAFAAAMEQWDQAMIQQGIEHVEQAMSV